MPQTIDRGGVRRARRPARPAARPRRAPSSSRRSPALPPHPRRDRARRRGRRSRRGATLLLADVVARPRRRRRKRRGVAVVALAPGFRPAVDRAFDLGVRVERMRVAQPRPAAALVRVVYEHRPALVVFAPDPGALGRWRWRKRRRFRRLVTALERDAPCLLWTAREPAEQPIGDVPSARAARS